MSTHTGLIEDLQWRGLLHSSTDLAQLAEHLRTGKRKFYVGFDPSAPSLTIGNLLAMSLVLRGQRAGLEGVVLFGGATGKIGDPSGKSAERTLLSDNVTASNVKSHQGIMASIFERGLYDQPLPEFVDNDAWLGQLSAIELLREIGRHFPLPELLRRDSVRRRLEDPTATLTFTEFSYSLLQAYDFMCLNRDRGVTLQMGASDQWGNIVAGIDYVRRVARNSVFGLTCPLLLRRDGSKFGKTEQGAVWLTADRTSPYNFYQFLLNLSDEEARQFTLYFSLKEEESVRKIFRTHEDDPTKRHLQHHLARELTALVHGDDAASTASDVSAALFGGDISAVDEPLLQKILKDAPVTILSRARLTDGRLLLTDLMLEAELASSKREAREHISAGAVSMNGVRVQDLSVDEGDLLHGGVIFIKRGKREWRTILFR